MSYLRFLLTWICCPLSNFPVGASSIRAQLTISLPYLGICSFRHTCRKSELRWKATQLEIHQLHLKELLVSYNRMVRDARTAYFARIIASSKGNSKVLFDTMNSTVSPASSQIPVISHTDCNNFLNYFFEKVKNVIANISPSSSHPVGGSSSRTFFDSFSPITLDISKILPRIKPSSTPFDILPSSLFLNVFNTTGPSTVSMINLCLSGSVPHQFKHAVVKPVLKKPNPDPSLFQNYRPISKLPFLAKLLEKTVAEQLTAVLDNQLLYDTYQSGYRKLHSTEMALVKVTNDILMAADDGRCTLMVLLDLSCAFNTVDHEILYILIIYILYNNI